jgi:hypothetical protein
MRGLLRRGDYARRFTTSNRKWVAPGVSIEVVFREFDPLRVEIFEEPDDRRVGARGPRCGALGRDERKLRGAANRGARWRPCRPVGHDG